MVHSAVAAEMGSGFRVQGSGSEKPSDSCPNPETRNPSARPTALDLGSGPSPAAGYVGVDVCGTEGSGFRVQGSSSEGPSDSDPHSAPRVILHDLMSGTPWPFEDGSIERLRASHVIEHIPRDRVRIGQRRVVREIKRPGQAMVTEHSSIPIAQDAFFWFFDEAFRVAAPGCRFELAWPHPQHDHADQDPTHARRIPSATLHYLSKAGRRALRVTQYPVECDWHVESVTEMASDEALAPFLLPDGSVDLAAARRAHGVFHEIRAVLVKPLE